MDLAQYRRDIAAIPGGKRLPNALYLHVDGIASVGSELLGVLVQAQRSVGVDPDSFNLIKFHLDELKLSFLHYPEFDSEAHPRLAQSTIVDLASATTKVHRYHDAINPPILHRKETFLPVGHPKAALYAELTEEEERLGLYENQTRIGFFKQWQELLEQKGIRIVGHRILVDQAIEEIAQEEDVGVVVDRHKTAISRFGLSKSVQALLRHDILTPTTSLFDYGCGLGDDLRSLNLMGYQATGWDPVYRPESPKAVADIVNLGYVINVIEAPEERVEVLRDAFRLCRVVLAVSAMIRAANASALGTPYRDGVLTGRNTFQKYYSQEELGQFIENALDVEAIAVCPGAYLVFRDAADRQRFLARRSRRTIDWASLSARIFSAKPRQSASRPYPSRPQQDVYATHQNLIDAFWDRMVHLGRLPRFDEFERSADLDAAGLSPIRLRALYVQRFGQGALDSAFLSRHQELLDGFWAVLGRLGRIPTTDECPQVHDLAAIGLTPLKAKNLFLRKHGQDALREAFLTKNAALLEMFWNLMIDMGRLPREIEFDRCNELREIGLTPTKARDLFIERYGAETLTESVAIRRNDLLVYLALANFKRVLPLNQLDARMQTDIKTFFGGYRQALDESRQLLFSVGRPDRIEELCNSFSEGHRDEQALYIHRSLVAQLPPELRVYIGCAQVLYGDLDGVDIIKLHKRSGKVTLLIYDNFEYKRLPILVERVKIKLREQDTEVFQYERREQTQVLYNKDLYVGADHPRKQAWTEYGQRLERIIGPIVGYGPTLEELTAQLGSKGYSLGLRRLDIND